MADRSRHGLFRYLTADESADYLAIMDLFSATLLTDLSAAEVASELAERGLAMERDIAEVRCRQLIIWGNLVPSLRDARVSTVAEYIRSRSRYQVSKLGGRLHREARRHGGTRIQYTFPCRCANAAIARCEGAVPAFPIQPPTGSA